MPEWANWSTISSGEPLICHFLHFLIIPLFLKTIVYLTCQHECVTSMFHNNILSGPKEIWRPAILSEKITLSSAHIRRKQLSDEISKGTHPEF